MIRFFFLDTHRVVRKSKLPGDVGDGLDSKFTSGTSCDDDFMPFLQSRPQRIALSMLQSHKAEAQREAEDSSLPLLSRLWVLR